MMEAGKERPALRLMPPHSDEAPPSPAQKHSEAPCCLQDEGRAPLSAVKALPDLVPTCLPCLSPSSSSHAPSAFTDRKSCYGPSVPTASHLQAFAPAGPYCPACSPPFSRNLPASPIKSKCLISSLRRTVILPSDGWLMFVYAPRAPIRWTISKAGPCSLTLVPGLMLVCHVAEAQPIFGEWVD